MIDTPGTIIKINMTDIHTVFRTFTIIKLPKSCNQTVIWWYCQSCKTSSHIIFLAIRATSNDVLIRLFVLDSLWSSLSRLTSKETSPHPWHFGGKPPVTGDSPHKGPLMRRVFPFYDVIMVLYTEQSIYKENKETAIYKRTRRRLVFTSLSTQRPPDNIITHIEMKNVLSRSHR